MSEMADSFWLIAPDTPGYGESFSPSPLPTVQLYSDVLRQSLAALGVSHCAIFGHHTGAATAVQLASDHPQLVSKLALSGPPLISDSTKQALLAQVGPTVPQEDGSHMVSIWSRIRSRDPDAPLSLVQRETLLTLTASRYHETYKAVFDQDFAALLPQVQCPVMVLAGEHDTLRAGVEAAAALLPNARVEIVPDAGIYICDRQPARLAVLLRNFFLHSPAEASAIAFQSPLLTATTAATFQEIR